MPVAVGGIGDRGGFREAKIRALKRVNKKVLLFTVANNFSPTYITS